MMPDAVIVWRDDRAAIAVTTVAAAVVVAVAVAVAAVAAAAAVATTALVARVMGAVDVLAGIRK